VLDFLRLFRGVYREFAALAVIVKSVIVKSTLFAKGARKGDPVPFHYAGCPSSELSS
jgi:hypothetical protein